MTGSPEWIERNRAGQLCAVARRRERWAVVPADLRAAERGSGKINPAARPHVMLAGDEAAEIAAAAGGIDSKAPGWRALFRSQTRLAAVETMLASRIFATSDFDLVPKLVAVSQARRGLLERLGLEWATREKSLEAYLAERAAAQAAPSAPIDVQPDRTPMPNAEDVAAPDDGSDDAREAKP